MEAGKVEELKGFVQHAALQIPSSLDAPVPSSGESGKGSENIPDEEIVESDVELDNSEIVEPDNDPPQKMGDPSAEVTEENQEAAQLLKTKATDAVSDG